MYDTAQNLEDYIACFRQLAIITSRAMDSLEQSPPIQLSALDRIAHNVETIACIRGDSGVYTRNEPPGTEIYRSEMYKTENDLRYRLLSLGYKYPTPRGSECVKPTFELF